MALESPTFAIQHFLFDIKQINAHDPEFVFLFFMVFLSHSYKQSLKAYFGSCYCIYTFKIKKALAARYYETCDPPWPSKIAKYSYFMPLIQILFSTEILSSLLILQPSSVKKKYFSFSEDEICFELIIFLFRLIRSVIRNEDFSFEILKLLIFFNNYYFSHLFSDTF